MTTRRTFLSAIALAAGAGKLVKAGEHDGLVDRLNRFNTTMRDFRDQLQFKNIVDVREQRLMSKQFRELEKCGEWPEYRE